MSQPDVAAPVAAHGARRIEGSAACRQVECIELQTQPHNSCKNVGVPMTPGEKTTTAARRGCCGAAPPSSLASAIESDLSPRPAVSVIVPLFNEEDSVRPLYEAIVRALDEIGRPFEM